MKFYHAAFPSNSCRAGIFIAYEYPGDVSFALNLE